MAIHPRSFATLLGSRTCSRASTNIALMVLVMTGAVVAYVSGFRDSLGMLVLPLTALQLLWINFVGDGPPALALALDRTPGRMDCPPRPPSSGLLDAMSSRFILATGLFKGALGIALLTLLPAAGFGLIVTQTVVFLYESIGKVVTVYPSRSPVRGRPNNWILHASVVGAALLQIAAVAVPGLRHFLGLAALEWTAVAILFVAVVATWAVAALTRRVLSAQSKAGPVDSPKLAAVG